MNFKESLTNHNLFIRHIRYVDNRLIFGDKRLQQLHPYEVLLGEGFYGRPIVLETEPDQEFLGFMLETPPLTPSSTSSAPAPSPTIPAAAASSSSPDPTGPATYASDLSAQGAPPFPPAETSWEHRRPQTFFTEQTVHQVFFEVFTFDNERRELWINEIDFRGYSRLREPEQYFYSLTGDDAYARHTSDYRRVFFNIPNTQHFDNPHYYGHHHYNLHPTAAAPPSTTPSTSATSAPPNTATSAAQLQERLFAPPTPGSNPTTLIGSLSRTLTPTSSLP